MFAPNYRVTTVVRSFAVNANTTSSKTWNDSLLYDQELDLYDLDRFNISLSLPIIYYAASQVHTVFSIQLDLKANIRVAFVFYSVYSRFQNRSKNAALAYEYTPQLFETIICWHSKRMVISYFTKHWKTIANNQICGLSRLQPILKLKVTFV